MLVFIEGRADADHHFIGTFIGIVPATGSGTASFAAYSETKRHSKHPELFGKGSIEGIAATESANNAVTGGAIPKEYIPSVDQGIQGAMASGVLAGYPVVDVKVTLLDGSYHEVDSSEMAFKICGSMAFKEAAQKAGPTLLEPIMKVVVTTPDQYMGDVIGDLNSRRGQVVGTDIRNGAAIVTAEVPLASMFGYSTDLRSKTQGRANYSMEPHTYVELPKSLQESIIGKRGNNA